MPGWLRRCEDKQHNLKIFDLKEKQIYNSTSVLPISVVKINLYKHHFTFSFLFSVDYAAQFMILEIMSVIPSTFNTKDCAIKILLLGHEKIGWIIGSGPNWNDFLISPINVENDHDA